MAVVLTVKGDIDRSQTQDTCIFELTTIDDMPAVAAVSLTGPFHEVKLILQKMQTEINLINGAS